MAITKSMRKLMVHYAAHLSPATDLDDVDWAPLAQRLRVDSDLIDELLLGLGNAQKQELWQDVMQRRIDHVQSNPAFRQITWEEVEHRAVDKLRDLMEKGLIRDPHELLAITKVANGINTGASKSPDRGQHSVNIGFNFNQNAHLETQADGEDEDMNQIPGKVQALQINLSPRTAEALSQEREVRAGRVLDADRVDVEELRSLNPTDDKDTGTEG